MEDPLPVATSKDRNAMTAALGSNMLPGVATLPSVPLPLLLDGSPLRWGAAFAHAALQQSSCLDSQAEHHPGGLSAAQPGQSDVPAQGRGLGANTTKFRQKPGAYVQETGLIDPSAFGMDYKVEPSSVPEPEAAGGWAASTGQLDLSAFGMGYAPDPPKEDELQCQIGAVNYAVDSGEVDLSASGMGFMPEPSTPDKQEFSTPAAVGGTLDTGQIDLSAFGMDYEVENPYAQQTDKSTMDTGELDMGAFGLEYSVDPSILQRPESVRDTLRGEPANTLVTNRQPSKLGQHKVADEGFSQDEGVGTGHVSHSNMLPHWQPERMPGTRKAEPSERNLASSLWAPEFKPSAPAFDPLSPQELSDLRRLLGVLPLPNPGHVLHAGTRSPSHTSPALSGTGSDTGSSLPDYEAEQGFVEVVQYAELLAQGGQDAVPASMWAAMDGPARRVITSLQVSKVNVI